MRICTKLPTRQQASSNPRIRSKRPLVSYNGSEIQRKKKQQTGEHKEKLKDGNVACVAQCQSQIKKRGN